MKLSFNCPISTNDLENNHCKICSRTLIDCTNMSNDQIQSLAKEKNDFCGIFKSSQIKNKEQSKTQAIFKLAFLWVFVLGLNSAKASDIFVQDNIQIYESSDTNVVDSTLIYPKIKIHVFDEKNVEPIPFAKIVITKLDGQKIIAITDWEGNATINSPLIKIGECITIESHFVGYETMMITNVIVKSEMTIDVKMLDKNLQIMGFLIIDYFPPLIPSDPYDFNKTTINPNER